MKIQVVESRTSPYTKKCLGWFFRIVAKNGKTLCHSESYTSKQSAMKTAKLLKRKIGCKLEQI